MTPFKYRALDGQGAEQNGLLDAADRDVAIALLHKRGLMVLQIEPSSLGGLRQALGRGTLSGAALMSFTQQLATLLGAGQPLERSLTILLRQPGQSRNQIQTRALIERIREQVKAGKPLSVALEEEGRQFSPLYISMVRAGEAGGALENTLRQLSDDLPGVSSGRRARLSGAAAGLRGPAVRADLPRPRRADSLHHPGDSLARAVPQ